MIASFALMQSQGFWDCVVYGLLSKKFRAHYSGYSGIMLAIVAPLLVFPLVILKFYYTFMKTEEQTKEKSDNGVKYGNAVPYTRLA